MHSQSVHSPLVVLVFFINGGVLNRDSFTCAVCTRDIKGLYNEFSASILVRCIFRSGPNSACLTRACCRGALLVMNTADLGTVKLLKSVGIYFIYCLGQADSALEPARQTKIPSTFRCKFPDGEYYIVLYCQTSGAANSISLTVLVGAKQPPLRGTQDWSLVVISVKWDSSNY